MKKTHVALLLLAFLSSCGKKNKSVGNSYDEQMEAYTTFNKANHLQPVFNKALFDTLHSWDFGWAILEPINIAKSREEDKELSKRFSPGQKALYFFWYLDDEVTNGGFIQFYWNGYRHYVPTIREGLKLIGDKELLLLLLLDKADQAYITHKENFELQRQRNDWPPLYDNLKEFDDYDKLYYEIHDRTMDLIENYARLHPEEFVKFKQ